MTSNNSENIQKISRRNYNAAYKKIAGYLSGCRHFSTAKRREIAQIISGDYKMALAIKWLIADGLTAFNAINKVVYGIEFISE